MTYNIAAQSEALRQERAAKMRELGNQFKLDDPNAQRLYDIWFNQDLTSEQKDAVGRAWLEHLLGLEDDTIEAFINGNGSAYQAVGKRHCGFGNLTPDYVAFWEKIISITPEAYTPADKSWILEKAKDPYATTFFFHEIYSHGAQSDLVSRIKGNMQVFK